MARRLSVVIPVFRRQRELGFALRSLTEEARLIDEVVVVDDASPEPIRVEPPAELAGRVKLVRLDANAGSSAARQAGVEAASGDLVAFLDSDDAWLPGKLAAQLPLLEGQPDLTAVACGWQVVDLDSARQWSQIPIGAENPARFAAGCWFCPGSTVVVPRRAFKLCGPFDGTLRRLEDLDWFLRFGLAGGRLLVSDAIGAVIGRAARANLADVSAAADILEDRFARSPAMTPEIHRRLGAWLDVERAKAIEATHGRGVPFVRAVARSLLAEPRFRLKAQPPYLDLQLERWWREGAPAIAPVAALARLGLSKP